MEESRATSFCVRMWLIATTVVICLICTCFVMVKAPETKLEVSSTDMRLLDSVSGLWCQGQELVSTHKFNVYRFINDHEQQNHTKTRIEIDNVLVKLHIGPRKHQYLRYFLLSGSSVSVSAVSDRASQLSMANGTVNVVKGKEEMGRCLKELDDYVTHNGTSSEEEDDILPISQRRYKYLRWAVRTRFITARQGRSMTEVNVLEDDHYYILIVNDSSDQDISVTLRVSLTRIRFSVDDNDIVCNRVKHCLYHIGFGTEGRIVLDIPREPDAGRSTFIVRSVCRPRVFFYALLFILIPIIMLLVTGFIIKAYSTLLSIPHHNRTDIRSRIVRCIQSQSNADLNSGAVIPASSIERGPTVRPYTPSRQYVQALYQIPGEQGLLDRTPTPGTPPPSYASLEKSRKLTPPVCCAQCHEKMPEDTPLLLHPPPRNRNKDDN